MAPKSTCTTCGHAASKPKLPKSGTTKSSNASQLAAAVLLRLYKKRA